MNRHLQQQRHSFGRTGFTLVESLIIITTTMIFAVLAIRILILFMQAQAAAGVRTAHEQTLQHLEDQFRADARTAQTAAIEQNQTETILRLTRSAAPDVEYRFTPEFITRQVTNSGTLEEQDSFPLEPLRTRPATDDKHVQIVVEYLTRDNEVNHSTAILAPLDTVSPLPVEVLP